MQLFENFGQLCLVLRPIIDKDQKGGTHNLSYDDKFKAKMSALRKEYWDPRIIISQQISEYGNFSQVAQISREDFTSLISRSEEFKYDLSAAVPGEPSKNRTKAKRNRHNDDYGDEDSEEEESDDEVEKQKKTKRFVKAASDLSKKVQITGCIASFLPLTAVVKLRQVSKSFEQGALRGIISNLNSLSSIDRTQFISVSKMREGDEFKDKVTSKVIKNLPNFDRLEHEQRMKVNFAYKVAYVYRNLLTQYPEEDKLKDQDGWNFFDQDDMFDYLPDAPDRPEQLPKIPRFFQTIRLPKKINRDLLSHPHLLDQLMQCDYFKDNKCFEDYFALHKEILEEIIPSDEFQLLLILYPHLDPNYVYKDSYKKKTDAEYCKDFMALFKSEQWDFTGVDELSTGINDLENIWYILNEIEESGTADQRMAYLRKEIRTTIIDTLNEKDFFKPKKSYAHLKVVQDTNDIQHALDQLKSVYNLCTRVDYYETFKPYTQLFKSKIVYTDEEQTQQASQKKQNADSFFLTTAEEPKAVEKKVVTSPKVAKYATRKIKLSRGILSIVMQFLFPKQIRLRQVNKQFRDIFYEICMLKVDGPKMQLVQLSNNLSRSNTVPKAKKAVDESGEGTEQEKERGDEVEKELGKQSKKLLIEWHAMIREVGDAMTSEMLETIENSVAGRHGQGAQQAFRNLLRPLVCIPGDRFVFKHKYRARDENNSDDSDADSENNSDSERSSNNSSEEESYGDELSSENAEDPKTNIPDDKVLQFYQPRGKVDQQFIYESFLRFEAFNKYYNTSKGQEDIGYLRKQAKDRKFTTQGEKALLGQLETLIKVSDEQVRLMKQASSSLNEGQTFNCLLFNYLVSAYSRDSVKLREIFQVILD